MRIDEAIKILETYMAGSDEAEPVDFDNAVLLGIEALKRILRQRKFEDHPNWGHLEGETK